MSNIIDDLDLVADAANDEMWLALRAYLAPSWHVDNNIGNKMALLTEVETDDWVIMLFASRFVVVKEERDLVPWLEVLFHLVPPQIKTGAVSRCRCSPSRKTYGQTGSSRNISPWPRIVSCAPFLRALKYFVAHFLIAIDAHHCPRSRLVLRHVRKVASAFQACDQHLMLYLWDVVFRETAVDCQLVRFAAGALDLNHHFAVVTDAVQRGAQEVVLGVLHAQWSHPNAAQVDEQHARMRLKRFAAFHAVITRNFDAFALVDTTPETHQRSRVAAANALVAPRQPFLSALFQVDYLHAHSLVV